MESALIISNTEKSAAWFAEILRAASISHIVISKSCGEARRLLLEQDFDLAIVNGPLPDESGENLSRDIAAKGVSQVILLVRSEYFDMVSAVVEDDGVLTVAKPVSRPIFWSALTLARSAEKRIRLMRDENAKLKQKIEDIRITDRAKCILISQMNLSERDAHRHIEKLAMDLRTTKRAIAERIIKTYEL